MASLVEAVFGIGMIVGSTILMAWGGGKHLTLLIAVAAIITGVTTTACGFLSPNMFILFVVLTGLMAISCAWYNAPLITLVQRNVGEEKMGRALGFVTALIGVATPLGIFAGGLLAEGFEFSNIAFTGVGILPIFIGAGVLMVAVGVFSYSLRSIRALDKPDERATAE
jgi:DHA3 family macrolide efflux protein-like MFS transporter